MQAVADAVGVRAPSLYKRFADRSALLTAVADDVAADLARGHHATRHDPGPAAGRAPDGHSAIARSPIDSPRAYQLLFGAAGHATVAGRQRPGRRRACCASPRRSSGPAHALEAARLLVAFVHGFVSMELAGAFRLGGNVNAAWDYGLEAISSGG